MNPLILGLTHAILAMSVQVGLAVALSHVPPGTRAQATGACFASLSLVLTGILLGIRGRRYAEASAIEDSGLASLSARSRLELIGDLVRAGTESVPFGALFVMAGVLALVGVLGFGTQVFLPILPAPSLAVGGLARAIFATDAIVLPALALGALGALLGVGSRRGTFSTSFTAFLALVIGSWAGAEVARFLSYDPAIVFAYALAISALVALVLGFVVAWIRRRIAFVELVLVALYMGYAVYLSVALGPKTFISSANLPEEQILLALVLAPTLSYVVALVVGGSVGFLLLGGGKLDPGLGYEAKVALRYLRANRSDRFIGKVTLISVGGVCLGVMALIVVLSVMSGFEDDLKRKILGAHAHVVLGKTGDDFYEYQDVEARVADTPGVASAAAFVLGDGMVSSDVGLSGTIVKGIDLSNVRGIAELRENIEKGALEHLARPEEIPGARERLALPPTSTAALDLDADGKAPPLDGGTPIVRRSEVLGGRVLPGIVIGRELAKTLRVFVGDVVKVVSPVSEEIGPTGPQPKLRRFRVAGIFYSGMYEYDAKFTYVELKQAQTFFGLRGRVSGVEIKVTDVDDTARVVEGLKRRVGGHPYTIKDWREMNKELFSALLLEKLAMFIILTFIILVASFNIVATLIMIVLEKGKEIAILKSIGASDASVMKIFVVQGLIVGGGGAILGLLSGVSICALIARFGINLDQRVFYIERLPVVMSWGEIAAIAIAAVVISYLATIYPAITAAKLRPVEGLRDD